MTGRMIRKELEETQTLLPEGYRATLMRPPGGQLTEQVRQVCNQMNLSIIQWSVDPRDWATDCAAQVEEVVLSEADDGDIILLHDMSHSSVEAALHLIDQMLDDGYVFLTVSQLAMLKGIPMAPGQVYTRFSG